MHDGTEKLDKVKRKESDTNVTSFDRMGTIKRAGTLKREDTINRKDTLFGRKATIGIVEDLERDEADNLVDTSPLITPSEILSPATIKMKGKFPE